MATQSAYETSAGRVLKALLLGALTGGVALGAGHALLAAANLQGPHEDASFGGFLVSSIIATVGTAVGLLAALPIWGILHRLGLRQWWWAIALGLGLPCLLLGAMLVDLARKFGWVLLTEETFVVVAGQALGSSALTAFVVWRTAYAREPDRSEEVF